MHKKYMYMYKHKDACINVLIDIGICVMRIHLLTRMLILIPSSIHMTDQYTYTHIYIYTHVYVYAAFPSPCFGTDIRSCMRAQRRLMPKRQGLVPPFSGSPATKTPSSVSWTPSCGEPQADAESTVHLPGPPVQQ